MSRVIKRVPFEIIETPYESIRCTSCGCGRGISENGVDNQWAEETRKAIGMKCAEYFEDRESKKCEGIMEYESGNYISKQASYCIVKCDCGEEVYCHNFTNTCTCGADYNFAGQHLAPREQWGEETGETWSECY